MKIDNVITLGNGTNYLLLNELNYRNGKYFFGVEVDQNKHSLIINYVFIKEINKNSKVYAKLVSDNNMTKKLYNLFRKKSK